MPFVDASSEISPAEAWGESDVTHRRYKGVVFDLLPRGPAWSRDDEVLADVVESMATEPSRLDHEIARLLDKELRPSKTELLLGEWEATYGLPECDDAVPSSDDMRRLILALKVEATTGHAQSFTWWSGAYEALGYTLLWWEPGPEVMTCVDDCVDVIADDEWPFVSFQGLEVGNDDTVIECFVEGWKLGGTLQQAWWVWSEVYTDAGILRGVAGTATGYVVAVGESALLRRSTSDPLVWTSPTAPGGTNDIRAVAVGGYEGKVVFTVGTADTGTLISEDSGETWLASKLTGTDELHGVTRGDGLTFVAVGDSGEIWRSTDAGDGWASVTSPTANSLRGVANGDGFMIAVGASGTVIRSTTDGASWSSVTAPDNPAGTTLLHGVDAYGSTAVAVGATGYMMRSEDGGATWTELDALVATDLRGVTASKWGRWTAVGAGGVLLQSFDDGATWQAMTSPTTDDLYGVGEHITNGHAFAAGDNATILQE